MKAVALALALVATSQASDSWKQEFTTADYESMDLKQVFSDWKEAFGRGYPTIHEESRRFRIWAANLDMIIEHNSADLTYKLRLNQFADLTTDEFKIKVHGHKGSCLKRKPKSKGETTVIGRIEDKVMDKLKSFTAPDSIDWYVFFCVCFVITIIIVCYFCFLFSK